MLRDLVERFLDNVSERGFDATFLALLAAERFRDIHYLHGPLEFGKDFIAKRDADDVVEQYVFQNKAGDMGTPELRQVQGQLIEAATSALAHERFDPDARRNVVLALTGRLKGKAGVSFQDLANYVVDHFPNRTLTVWDRETFIDLLMRHGPEQLFRTGLDVTAYGAFYRLYGDLLQGKVNIDGIQKHFEDRLHAQAPVEDRISAVALEAHLFADAARQVAQPYYALQSMLAMLRAVLYEMESEPGREAALRPLLDASCTAVTDAAAAVLQPFSVKPSSSSDVLDAISGSGLFVSYSVICAQRMDALLLQCEFDAENRPQHIDRLATLVTQEPGCSHPLSDRYAVSVALAIRTLARYGRAREARHLLKESALWLVDRYWDESDGLAPCYASEGEEIRTLLGGPFSGVAVRREPASLLATALMDCACYVQDAEVYSGLRKDILSANIVPTYYQVRDTPGQFEYAAEDVVRMPNVEFQSDMPPFETLSHGSHLHGEPRSFRLASAIPTECYDAVALLMRDRYFPTTW